MWPGARFALQRHAAPSGHQTDGFTMTDWIISFIEEYGYVAILALMVAENIFPPIPSELIMPFAGFAAAKGELNPVGVVAAGVIGSLLGTLPWYYMARRIGQERLKGWAERHGRWFTVSPDDIDHAADWFHRRGPMAVFIGRLVPAVRSVISAPAGFAGMSVVAFVLWSAAGSLLWTGLLTGAGYLLESSWDHVAKFVDPIAKVILFGGIAMYLYRVIKGTGNKSGGDASKRAGKAAGKSH